MENTDPVAKKKFSRKQKVLAVLVVVAIGALGYFAWKSFMSGRTTAAGTTDGNPAGALVPVNGASGGSSFPDWLKKALGGGTTTVAGTSGGGGGTVTEGVDQNSLLPELEGELTVGRVLDQNYRITTQGFGPDGLPKTLYSVIPAGTVEWRQLSEDPWSSWGLTTRPLQPGTIQDNTMPQFVGNPSDPGGPVTMPSDVNAGRTFG